MVKKDLQNKTPRLLWLGAFVLGMGTILTVLIEEHESIG